MPTPPKASSTETGKSGRSPATLGQRIIRFILSFIAVVLIIDGLFGDRGLIDTLRARRQQQALTMQIARLKDQNARLRHQARRLREDPEAVEALARRDLGFIKAGEVLFIIKDVQNGSWK